MVLAQGIADRLKERREKFKAELRSEGRRAKPNLPLK